MCMYTHHEPPDPRSMKKKSIDGDISLNHEWRGRSGSLVVETHGLRFRRVNPKDKHGPRQEWFVPYTTPIDMSTSWGSLDFKYGSDQVCSFYFSRSRAFWDAEREALMVTIRTHIRAWPKLSAEIVATEERIVAPLASTKNKHTPAPRLIRTARDSEVIAPDL